MNVALLYVLAIAGIDVFGVIVGGWASNSKYAVLGSLRTCAQLISYEIPMGFAVVGVVMLAQSMSLVTIVEAQADVWNVVYQPIGFLVFFIAGMAEAQRIPFDLPEAEGDLGAGYHTEYSGMRFSLFMISEYLIMVFLSALTVILFFGGWNPLFVPLPPMVWFLLKTSFFIWLFMWFRFTFPRYRYDQLMSIGWKVLLPLALANILITGVFLSLP
jgi:NADH-quinone oxidoreductase subunit H